MPQLVAQTNMDDQSITRIRGEITQLLMWLSRDEQISKYLSVAYKPWACDLQH
jgi:mortality factor 4-like protein 1